MQNLRDQLLKAGVATKQHKQQVEQEKRRKRKKQQKGRTEAEEQAQQRQAHEARLAAQQAANRERAAAQRAALDAKEAQLRLQNIINYWQLPEEPDGRQRWYFTTRRNTINYLCVSNATADRLSAGDLAIVEQPGAEEEHYVLVEREAAEHIAPIDRGMIRFSNNLSTHT
ncbi:MAG: DUF2058 domain-containing protein [Candidatus Tectomicrobia bacterium]|nr:DUF2058 domain-containing protein [Candidatus Tectomicrobia bacterium]